MKKKSRKNYLDEKEKHTHRHTKRKKRVGKSARAFGSNLICIGVTERESWTRKEGWCGRRRRKRRRKNKKNKNKRTE